MFKNFFSRFLSGQPDPPPPKETGINPADSEAIDEFVRKSREMTQKAQYKPAPIYNDYPREKDDIPKGLKLAAFKDGSIEVRVAYAIFHGNRCVFTAARRYRIRTDICGEGIIYAIAEREQRRVTSMRYYDLRTLTGYPRWKGGSGRVEFDQLLLSWHKLYPNMIDIYKRHHTACPEYVLELFKEYIAGSEPQIIHRGASRDF